MIDLIGENTISISASHTQTHTFTTLHTYTHYEPTIAFSPSTVPHGGWKQHLLHVHISCKVLIHETFTHLSHDCFKYILF